MTNLKNEKTNPKNLSSILEIDTEIGQILYRYIDTKIYGKNVFEKASAALFHDLFGNDNVKSYRWKSSRKRVLKRHIDHIKNSVLSSGKLLCVFLLETSDKKDVKIVCKTVSPDSDSLPSGNRKHKLVVTDKSSVDIDGLALAMQDVVGVDDPNWVSWTKRLAKSYSANLIYRVNSEFNEAVRNGHNKIEHRDKFFTSLFHSTVHKTGGEWIGRCDKHCRKRPEHENTTN